MASNVIMVADVILSELLDSQTVFQEDRRSTSPQGSIPENSETFVLSFLGLSYVCPVICNLHMCFEFCESVSKLATYQQHDGG